MKEDDGCALLNAVKDNVLPASFLDKGHVHIIVRRGELSFYEENIGRSFTGIMSDFARRCNYHK